MREDAKQRTVRTCLLALGGVSPLIGGIVATALILRHRRRRRRRQERDASGTFGGEEHEVTYPLLALPARCTTVVLVK